MKLILSEKDILTTIRLSGTQKAVLTKIIASANEQVAYETISDGRNMVAARDILSKLGLVEFSEGSATVTDKGKQVMKDENLMDNSDQLTPDGQKFSQGKPEDQKADTTKPAPAPSTDTGAESPASPVDTEAGRDGGDDLNISMENDMTLLTSVHRQLCENRFKELTNFTSQEMEMITTAQKGDNEDELPYDLMSRLQEVAVEYDPLWMPYGTQKARTGDPHEWIYENLDELVSIIKKSAGK